MLFRVPVVFLVLIVACMAAPTSPRVNSSDPEVARRWYSLPEDRDIIPQGYRVWPPSDDGSRTMPSEWHSTLGEPPQKAVTKRWWSVQQAYDAQSIDPQPWPPSDDGKHTVAYCFESQNVFAELGGIFTRALAKWAVAIQASSLEFTPDPECDRLNQSPCLCTTPGVADETLHIMQSQQGQPPFNAESTLGYRNPNFPRQIGRPRHFVMWPANANHFGTPSHGGLAMAHELGL